MRHQGNTRSAAGSFGAGEVCEREASLLPPLRAAKERRGETADFPELVLTPWRGMRQASEGVRVGQKQLEVRSRAGKSDGRRSAQKVMPGRIPLKARGEPDVAVGARIAIRFDRDLTRPVEILLPFPDDPRTQEYGGFSLQGETEDVGIPVEPKTEVSDSDQVPGGPAGQVSPHCAEDRRNELPVPEPFILPACMKRQRNTE